MILDIHKLSKSIKDLDHIGVAPLNTEGNTYTNAKHKAQILNKQFEYVFTSTDMLSMPPTS